MPRVLLYRSCQWLKNCIASDADLAAAVGSFRAAHQSNRLHIQSSELVCTDREVPIWTTFLAEVGEGQRLTAILAEAQWQYQDRALVCRYVAMPGELRPDVQRKRYKSLVEGLLAKLREQRSSQVSPPDTVRIRLTQPPDSEMSLLLQRLQFTTNFQPCLVGAPGVDRPRNVWEHKLACSRLVR